MSGPATKLFLGRLGDYGRGAFGSPGAPLLLKPPLMTAPAKKLDLGTKDCPGSRTIIIDTRSGSFPEVINSVSFRGGTMACPNLALSLSGAGGASPFGGMNEFGAAPVCLFRNTSGDNPIYYSTPDAVGVTGGINPWPGPPSWDSGTLTVPVQSNGAVPLVGDQIALTSGYDIGAYAGTFTVSAITYVSTNPNYPGYVCQCALVANPGSFPYAAVATVTDTTHSTLGKWTIGTPRGGAAGGGDSWGNCAGPYPGVYPNRPHYPYGNYPQGNADNIPWNWYDGTQTGYAITYPAWEFTVTAYPSKLPGLAAGMADTLQYTVTCSSGAGSIPWLVWYWAVWGKVVPLTRPWPGVMSIDGLALPWLFDAVNMAYPYNQIGTLFRPDFSFAGSTVTVSRISKPSYPYHG